jgi:hypothetical protein
MISLVPGLSLTITANTAYALPSGANQLTWEPTGAGWTLQSSLDNSSWETIDTSTEASADQRIVAISANFIKVVGGSAAVIATHSDVDITQISTIVNESYIQNIVNESYLSTYITNSYIIGKIKAGEYSIGNMGSSVTINWNNGSTQYGTLNSATCAITLSNPQEGSLGRYFLLLTQDGTGSRLVTWPASVILWSGGDAPTLSTAASARDLITLQWVAGISRYIGAYNLDNS